MTQSRIPVIAPDYVIEDADTGTVSFSVAWGRNGSARHDFRPYKSDAEAKQYRDDLAAVFRMYGYKVRCSSLRGQRREYWAWQVPCDLTCTVYSVEVLAHPVVASLAA